MPRNKTQENICAKEGRHQHNERHQTTEQTARYFYFKVCRVCLATRVKMHYLTEQRLSDMYKQVTGIEINNDDTLPKVLCWECVARLSKASNFIEKALRTRWILTNKQLNNGVSFTINSITSMNKTEYGLNSTLGYKFFNGSYADVHIVHTEDDNDVTGLNEAEVDKGAGNSNKEETVINDDDIKSEPVDINVDLENEVFIKDECFSDEEMVVESNEKLQESIKKELPLNDNDNNRSHTSIKERIRFDGGGSSNDPGNTMDVNNKKQYTCDICNKTFICRTRIARHLENHPEIFSCNYCAYKTSQKDHLIIHTNAEHSRSLKGLHCSFCSYSTYDKNTLQQHINAQHIKNTLFSCTFCAFKANSKNNLNRHITSHHSKPTTLDCSFCDFKTLQRIQLVKHMNIRHTKTVSFVCSFCNYKTYDKYSLSSHINTKHIKSTIYKCSFCTYIANEKYDLTRHVKAKHK